MSNVTAVLDRVQGDYAFYVRLQSDPDAALAEYALTADERATITNPALLAQALEQALPFRITITVKGRHDWVNRTPKRTSSTNARAIEREADLVRRAASPTERRQSALRLIELLD